MAQATSGETRAHRTEHLATAPTMSQVKEDRTQTWQHGRHKMIPKQTALTCAMITYRPTDKQHQRGPLGRTGRDRSNKKRSRGGAFSSPAALDRAPGDIQPLQASTPELPFCTARDYCPKSLFTKHVHMRTPEMWGTHLFRLHIWRPYPSTCSLEPSLLHLSVPPERTLRNTNVKEGSNFIPLQEYLAKYLLFK